MHAARALALAAVTAMACATTQGPSEPPQPHESGDEPPPDGAEPPMSAEAVRAVLEAELRLQEGDAPAAIQLLKEAVLFDPASPYLHVRLAEAHLDAGDAEQAGIAARAALALDPRSVLALRVLAASHAITGEVGAAQRSYVRALQIAPGDRQTSTALTELLVEQGDIAGAERVVEDLMRAEPGAVDGYVALGRIFAQRGDVARARAHLERALAREPLDRDALDLLLALHEALGQFEDARRVADTLSHAVGDAPLVRRELLALTALAGHVEESEEMARSWLEDDSSESMKLLVADSWQRAGAPERALAVLATASGPRVLLDRARTHLVLRRFAEARRDACAAVDAAPDVELRNFAVSLCVRGWLALGKPADAAALLQRHLAERPAAPLLLDSAVTVLRRRAPDVDRAPLLAALEQAAALASSDADVVAALSRAAEDSGDVPAARAAFDAALRARPSDPDLLFALARFLERQGQAQAAVEVAERLVERGRTDVDTLNFVAFTLADASLRPEDARRYAWRALMLDPLNGYVVDTLGWAAHAAGDAGAAAELLARADRLSPQEGEVLFHLATAQKALGETARAIATARRARPLLDDEPRVRARVDALLASLGADPP